MVVDDSPYMRRLLSDMVASAGMRVTDAAADGQEALRKLARRRPDVVLLDLEMPRMDGLEFLERVMEENPLPVVAVSGHGQRGTQIFFDALESGAVDFLPLNDHGSTNLQGLESLLAIKIRAAARANPDALAHRRLARTPLPKPKIQAPHASASKVVVIGGSTGAPTVVQHILSELPRDLPAGLLIVQHMLASLTGAFARRLNEVSELEVKEAAGGEVVTDGLALLAPGDHHMVVGPKHRVELNQGPKRQGVRPSINALMVSASEVFRDNTVGVLLSGMGHDGAFGMKIIKRGGGTTMAQDEGSSVIFGMAKTAFGEKSVDKLVPAGRMSREIVRAVEEVGEE
ncbi:MAG TPA: chemotaxis-specific protein-glutamate methyltransferase CheB [Nitrososphaerales archaeon]|nr:chemotaxis-specific protein-glutamate methyltransferase CheB [Nitrososphaerales archaeon]